MFWCRDSVGNEIDDSDRAGIDQSSAISLVHQSDQLKYFATIGRQVKSSPVENEIKRRAGAPPSVNFSYLQFSIVTDEKAIHTSSENAYLRVAIDFVLLVVKMKIRSVPFA